MKKTFGNMTVSLIMLLAFTLSLTSCYETHYYHRYNHHTREWYGHHHQQPPANINFEVDVSTRHHHRY